MIMLINNCVYNVFCIYPFYCLYVCMYLSLVCRAPLKISVSLSGIPVDTLQLQLQLLIQK